MSAMQVAAGAAVANRIKKSRESKSPRRNKPQHGRSDNNLVIDFSAATPSGRRMSAENSMMHQERGGYIHGNYKEKDEDGHISLKLNKFYMFFTIHPNDKFEGNGEDEHGEYDVKGFHNHEGIEFTKNYHDVGKKFWFRGKLAGESDKDNQEFLGTIYSDRKKTKVHGEFQLFYMIISFPMQAKRQLFVQMDLEKIDKIDSVNETYELQFDLIMTWALQMEDLTELSKKPIDEWEGPDWKPNEPDVVNGHGDFSVDPAEHYTIMMEHGILFAQHKLTYRGACLEKLELQAFPFDTQTLPIILDFEESIDTLEVLEDEDYLLHTHPGCCQVSEWEMFKPIAEIVWEDMHDGTDWDLTPKHTKTTHFIVNLKFKRNWVSYFWKIILVMAIITLSTIGAFFLDYKEQGPDRTNHVTTMFLTAAVYQLVTVTFLPNLDYLTVLDKYNLTQFFFIMVMLFETSVIPYLSWVGKVEECLYNEDRAAGEEYFCIAENEDEIAQLKIFNDWIIFGHLIAWVGINVIFTACVYFYYLPHEAKKITLYGDDLADFNHENDVAKGTEHKIFRSPNRSDKQKEAESFLSKRNILYDPSGSMNPQKSNASANEHEMEPMKSLTRNHEAETEETTDMKVATGENDLETMIQLQQVMTPDVAEEPPKHSPSPKRMPTTKSYSANLDPDGPEDPEASVHL